MKKVNFEFKNFGRKLKTLGFLAENKEFSRSAVNKRTESAQSLPISSSLIPHKMKGELLKNCKASIYSQPEDGTCSSGFSAQTNTVRKVFINFR